MAAEIEGSLDGRRPAAPASMRPRRMAAEIGCCQLHRRRGGDRFNEAAANGRGNPARWRLQAVAGPASMRPRRMAAEILPLVVHQHGDRELQ